jgi:hypothetical protein
MAIFFGIVFLGIAAGLFYAGRSQKDKATSMAATETSTAQLLGEIHKNILETLDAESLNQRCEIKGVIECDTPLTAPLSGKQCVAYAQMVTRQYEEEVTETDSDGNTETKTQRGHETVETTDQRVNFWVRDETGRTVVDPTEAELDMKQTGENYENEPDTLWSTNRRRTLGHTTTEHALEVGAEVYILGFLVDMQGQPVVARSRAGNERFLISWRREEELTSAAEGSRRGFEIGAYVCAALGVILLITGFL